MGCDSPPHLTPTVIRNLGRIADGCLFAAIVIAPVAGGSSYIAVLPILALLVAVATTATVLGAYGKGNALSVPFVVIGLLVLSVITAMQIIPLPHGLLAAISPRAAEVRAFVDDGLSARPLSYEPSATAREAAKLLLLALVALVAAERTRASGRFRQVAVMVVVAGLASATIALVHRVLGAEQMLGVLPTLRAPHELITTFVNPNHAAGFMVLTAMSALGLALSAKHRRPRMGWLTAAAVLAFVSVLGFSRGGLIALAVAMGCLCVGLVRLRKQDNTRERTFAVPTALLIAVTVSAVAAVLWRMDEVARQFAGTPSDPLSLTGKLAAMRDAWPMVLDHGWTGIGRGSYISAYAAYKTYPYQFTFSHPENLLIEAISDWGLIIGPFAVGGLFAAIAIRFWSARSVVAAAALAGVAAVTVQNFVDFSLEILGASLPVAAILGGSGLSVVASLKVPRVFLPALIVAILPLAGLVFAAFHLGDLEQDQQDLRAMIRDQAPRLPLEDLEARAARHPANAAIAAQVSYLAETQRPLDGPTLGRALRWANRALYLDPNYADAHLASGRILITAGYRDQGFGALRRAWSLAVDSLRGDAFVNEIIRLADTPAELIRSIPRQNPKTDTIDAHELARMLRHLGKLGQAERARAVLTAIGPRLADLSPEGLLILADEARRLGDQQLAVALLSRRMLSMPQDARGALLLFDVQMKMGHLDMAQETIERGLAAAPLDALPFHRRAFDLALRRNDVATARTVLERMRFSMSPTDQNQVMALQLESKVELADGRPGHAIAALDGAVRLSPTTSGLRIERARIALRLGRERDARSDLDAVLRLEPTHPEVRRMMAELDTRKNQRMMPD